MSETLDIQYNFKYQELLMIEKLLSDRILTKLFFVDGDNCAGFISKLQTSEKSYVLVFHAQRIKIPQYTGMSYISTLTNRSDAADHALSMEASRLDILLPKNIEFCIVTSDWFFAEVCQRIIMMGRKCTFMDGNGDTQSMVDTKNVISVENTEIFQDCSICSRIGYDHFGKFCIKILLDKAKELLQKHDKPLKLSLLGQRIPLPEEIGRSMGWKSIILEKPIQEYLNISFKDEGPGKQWIIRNI